MWGPNGNTRACLLLPKSLQRASRDDPFWVLLGFRTESSRCSVCRPTGPCERGLGSEMKRIGACLGGFRFPVTGGAASQELFRNPSSRYSCAQDFLLSLQELRPRRPPSCSPWAAERKGMSWRWNKLVLWTLGFLQLFTSQMLDRPVSPTHLTLKWMTTQKSSGSGFLSDLSPCLFSPEVWWWQRQLPSHYWLKAKVPPPPSLLTTNTPSPPLCSKLSCMLPTSQRKGTEPYTAPPPL